MDTQEYINNFLKAVNKDEDYIKGHDIGRELLLSGKDKPTAKLMASIAGLAQQYVSGKKGGYEKFKKMVTDKLTEQQDQPFDEQHILSQLEIMDSELENASDSRKSHKFTVKLK